MQILLLVGLGGFAGALLRHSLTLFVELFPLSYSTAGVVSILFINNVGSFLCGLLANKIYNETFHLIFITGFLGSFTTFSAFSRVGMKLFYDKSWLLFFGFLLFNSVGSLIFFHLGHEWSK